MNAEQFLARVVGPGNYLAIAWKDPARKTGGMIHRFFERADVSGAAGMLKWAASKGNDAWFALAGFEVAHPDGLDAYQRPKFKGERLQTNASHLKCFWLDIDVRRQGDGKKDAGVYATTNEAVLWAKQFMNGTGLPAPNLWVNSGYGIHLYWVLEDAMTRADWQPYANAFASALTAHGFKCETGISSDAARLLRPPETLNFKAGPPGVPVTVRPATRGDYPNDLVLDKLRPYLGAPGLGMPASHTMGSPPGGLASGGPSPLLAGAGPNLNAAAQANIQTAPPKLFSEIATKCEQVKQSLAVNGDGDDRPIWYLGNLSLAHHCSDGAAFAHELGKGDPRYSAAGTDAAVAQIANEKATKDTGPPTCAYYDKTRPGVCQTCPFNGVVKSPWELGVPPVAVAPPPAPGVSMPMPDGYNYNPIKDEIQLLSAKGSFDRVCRGNITNVSVSSINREFVIDFTYSFGHRVFSCSVKNSQAVWGGDKLAPFFAEQSITVDAVEAKLLGGFLVAFINDVRSRDQARTDDIKPFGFATTMEGKHIGIAVGGVLYRSDTSLEPVPGLPQNIEGGFKPRGSLAHWQKTFDIVCRGRPELQILVAGSFGAPLMKFTGEKGVTISAWTPESGAGKSSAMTLAQTVWSHPIFMSSMDDTDNMAARLRATTAIMPSIWDEKLNDKGKAKTFTEMLFAIAQGKEKGRLNSNLDIQELKQWQTLLLVTNNTQLMDNVTSTMTSSDAGQLRLLEYFCPRATFTQDPKVALMLQNTQHNCGHAGREFIKYVSTNYDTVEKMVLKLNQGLQVKWNAQGEERLYFAGIAAIIAGAQIAKSLKIADFDIPTMASFLENVVLSSRRNRATNSMTKNGELDVEEVLGQFCLANHSRKLTTDRVPVQGGSVKPKILGLAPVHRDGVVIHEVDKVYTQLSTFEFATWCKSRNYNASTMIRMLKDKMGATEARARWCSQVDGYDIKALLRVIQIPAASFVPPAPTSTI